VKVGHALGSVMVVLLLLAGAEVVVNLKMASQSQFPD
jgi:hypothetical protein